MGVGEALAIALAGFAAGTINAVVGSGTLITFPVLLAFGYAPVTANVTNSVGLVPGSLSGAIGYRRELAGQAQRAKRLGVVSALGGVTGAALLLVLPASAFEAIVPAFIAIALALVILQPRLAAVLASRSPGREHGEHPVTLLALFAIGVYGGYFGAAQGILLLALLGLALRQDLHRTNALKNVLAGLVNGIAGLFFVVAAHVEWAPAGTIALGSIVGAQVGARYGRRLHPAVLRGLIVVVGLVAIARLVVF
ncbi:MAG TPA: sulfite exporter TauE/SafE family protein [Solirubrobacteraceae bacterium]|nr:sulfite exporter TauE/SafE family protein [Solirubrobacteraceae bacterium]